MRNNYGEEVNPADFGEAIGICFKKYFVFEGRASKSEFWYFFLFLAMSTCFMLFVVLFVNS